jgi:hypothetical protein
MTSSKDAARSLVIYFTSPEEKHDFAEWAKKAGSSLSPYIISKLRETRDSEAHRKPSTKPREIETLHEENRALKEELAFAKSQLNILQLATERARDLAHLDDSATRVFFNAKLIEALIQKGPMHNDTLITLLGAKDDLERRKALAVQLEALEGYGLVKKGSRGYRWVGDE